MPAAPSTPQQQLLGAAAGFIVVEALEPNVSIIFLTRRFAVKLQRARSARASQPSARLGDSLSLQALCPLLLPALSLNLNKLVWTVLLLPPLSLWRKLLLLPLGHLRWELALRLAKLATLRTQLPLMPYQSTQILCLLS